MAQNHVFLNLESVAASSGSLVVNLKTSDSIVNINQSLTATGLVAGQSPESMVAAMVTQFNIQLIQYGLNYTGSPIFSSYLAQYDVQQATPATFRITYTDHVICFFSESSFVLSVLADGTGCNPVVSTLTPLLATLQTFKNFAPIEGLDLNNLSDQTILYLIQLSSANLINLLNNKLVRCTFVHEDNGNWQKSFFLRQALPAVFFDGVRSRRPDSFSLYGSLVGYTTSLAWSFNHGTGELRYIPTQNLVFDYEPAGGNNEIRISYVAGNMNIPIAILSGLMALAKASLQGLGVGSNVQELKTGTFSVRFKNGMTIGQAIREDLSPYLIWNLS